MAEGSAYELNGLQREVGQLKSDVANLGQSLDRYAQSTSESIRQLTSHVHESREETLGIIERNRIDAAKADERARAEFLKAVEQTRPNFTMLAAIGLTVVTLVSGAVANFVGASTKGEVGPLQKDVAHLQDQIGIVNKSHDADLQIRWQMRDRELELLDKVNQLEHSRADQRLTRIEGKLESRYSDQDDAQNARIEALQREIDLIRGKGQ